MYTDSWTIQYLHMYMTYLPGKYHKNTVHPTISVGSLRVKHGWPSMEDCMHILELFIASHCALRAVYDDASRSILAFSVLEL